MCNYLLLSPAPSTVIPMRARRQDPAPDGRKSTNLKLDELLFTYADEQAAKLGVSRTRWIAHLIAQDGGFTGYDIEPPEETEKGAQKTPA